MKNNKRYVWTILITTFLSVFTMIFYFDVKHYLASINERLKKNNNYINEKEILKENLDEFLLSDDYVEGSKNNTTAMKDENEDVEENDLYIYEKVDYEKIEFGEDHNLSDKVAEEYVDETKENETISVFKVDKNNIISKISSIDRLKIIRMANSLSVSDYKELINNIKSNEELLAAMNIFKLLKNKLSDKDYKELISILNPYINIEMIENEINKK